MNKKLKPLEALYKIANAEMKEQYKASKNGLVYRVISDEYSKELDTIEKSLKALDLFIKKQPCKSLIKLTKSHIEYNKSMPFIENELSKEEYDLLKEVLL